VKVWEPTVMELFRNLGNKFCNSVWEKTSQTNKFFIEDESDAAAINKPSPKDSIQQREKYFTAKVICFILKNPPNFNSEKCFVFQ